MNKLLISITMVALSGIVTLGSLGCGSKDKAINQKERTAKVDRVVNYNNDSSSYKLLAYDLATNFVKEHLQEPTTAEFPSTKEKLEHIEYLGNKRYRINSWVDSQDTYGAMARRSFSCIIKMDGSSVVKEKFMIEEHGYIPHKKQSSRIK